MRRIVTRLYLFIWLLLLRTCLLSANAQTNSLIQDPNLETAVRLTLQKPTGPLTEADLLSLTDLAAPNYQITSLGGLELARHLQVLQLAANPITNIGPLTGLSALRQLDLSFNPVGDPTPLLGLTNLEFLLLPLRN